MSEQISDVVPERNKGGRPKGSKDKPASTREFIKLLRAVGWEPAEMARRSGYSMATVNQWCIGWDHLGKEYRPPPFIIEHLARHAAWLKSNRLPFRRVRAYIKKSAHWSKGVSSLVE